MPIDLECLDGYQRLMQSAPKIFLRNLALSYRGIGQWDQRIIRENVTGKFNIKAKGLLGAMKAKATDPNKVKTVNQLFADVYTKWKGAEIFQNGGVITGRNGKLTILFSDARNATGRRKYTQQQLRQMLASGKARFVPTPRGVLIVVSTGGINKKSGRIRSGSKDTVIGILKRSVVEKKRLNFLETAEQQASAHQEILEYAIENTMAELAASK